MIVSCDEHLERAIDDFVDEYEEAPDIYPLEMTTFQGETLPTRCDYCEEAPLYVVNK